MLKLLTNLPDQVLGLRAEGIVTAEDYEKLLIPGERKNAWGKGKIIVSGHSPLT